MSVSFNFSSSLPSPAVPFTSRLAISLALVLVSTVVDVLLVLLLVWLFFSFSLVLHDLVGYSACNNWSRQEANPPSKKHLDFDSVARRTPKTFGATRLQDEPSRPRTLNCNQKSILHERGCHQSNPQVASVIRPLDATRAHLQFAHHGEPNVHVLGRVRPAWWSPGPWAAVGPSEHDNIAQLHPQHLRRGPVVPSRCWVQRCRQHMAHCEPSPAKPRNRRYYRHRSRREGVGTCSQTCRRWHHHPKASLPRTVPHVLFS